MHEEEASLTTDGFHEATHQATTRRHLTSTADRAACCSVLSYDAALALVIVWTDRQPCDCASAMISIMLSCDELQPW